MLPPPTQDPPPDSTAGEVRDLPRGDVRPTLADDREPEDDGQEGGSLEDDGPEEKARRRDKRAVSKRLTPVLAEHWTAIPDALIKGMALVKWNDGNEDKHLRAVHFLVIAHLLSAKWDERNPFISAKYIAEKSGISEKTILEAMTDLRDADLVRRIRRKGGDAKKVRYAYDLTPLFKRLEQVEQEILTERFKRARPGEEDR